jgi:hypothetical protein
MTTESEYTDRVKGLLKAELKRKQMTYEELVRRLADRGIKETPENIANKISRGKFTAVFMLQCLDAAGCRTLHIAP